MGRGRYNSRDRWRRDDDDYEDYEAYENYAEDRSGRRPAKDERYIYEDDEYELRPPRRRPDEISYPPSRTRHSHEYRSPSPRRETYTRRSQKRRSVWPALLGGCALGVFLVVLVAALIVIFAAHSLQGGSNIGISNLPGVLTMKPFSKDETQSLPASLPFSQILVCDQVGNVTLRVDPTANKPTVAIKKTVRAANQSDANKALQKIGVEIQPPNSITHALTCARPRGTPSTTDTPTTSTTPPPASSTSEAGTNAASPLTINVFFPTTDSFNHSVDLNITLPPDSLANGNGPSLPVDVEAPIGDITVDGLSGLLNIRGGTGNVTVKHAILVDGSHIETAQGNVTFNGYLAAPPTDASTQNGGSGARYIIQSEHNVDVTLPANTNVILDANTNVGKIASDFPITATNENGAMSYHGPLNPTATVKPSATLVLDVSTGNVTIHKSAEPA